ncbi:MAG: hypothetical protein ABI199_03775 [Bacteroidia bacterium]
MKTGKKKFDAVQMTRDIRNKMGEKYYQSIDLLLKDMEKVRKKYKITSKTQKAA